MTDTLRNSERYLFPLLFCVISLGLFNSFLIDKHLSADGVNLFIKVLEKGDFSYAEWSRQFGRMLIEWPLVIALQSGLRDIPTASLIYAAGTYFPYIFSFLLCLYAVRNDKKVLLLFPLTSMVGINLPSDYVLSSSHHVMVLLSWPVLLLLLRRIPLTPADGILLVFLLAFYTRLYEPAIIPSVIFGMLCLIRLVHYRQRVQVSISVLALLLCIIVFVISLYFIVNPRSPENKASFVHGAVLIFRNPEALLTFCFIILYTAGLWLQNRMLKTFSAVLVIIFVIVKFYADITVTSQVSFSSRTLSITLLPLLMGGAILVSRLGVGIDRTSFLIFSIFILIMTACSVYNAHDWKAFRAQMIQTLNSNRGYLQIEETALKDNPYRWNWNNTQLGIVWSAPCIKTIITNQNVRWQPFDPRKKLILKKYVRYDSLFSAVDKNVAICESAVSK